MYQICKYCPKIDTCWTAAEHCHRYNTIEKKIEDLMETFHELYDLERNINADLDSDSE